MTWNDLSDVDAAISWWSQSIGDSWGGLVAPSGSEFSASDKLTIERTLLFLYENSPTAQAILDLATQGGRQLRIYQSTPSQPAITPFLNRQPTGSVGFNL